MNKVTINGRNFRIMIPENEVVKIVEATAEKVNAAYRDSECAPLLMCTLTGSLPFMGALMTRLEFDPQISCIKVSSYSGTESTGKLKNVLGPTIPVEGRDVLIVEDIVDTGITLREMRRMFAEMGAKSVKVCTLLYKPEKFHAQEKQDGVTMTEPEFVGKEIPNAFILGFGLDYDEQGRCLRDIYVLDE